MDAASCSSLPFFPLMGVGAPKSLLAIHGCRHRAYLPPSFVPFLSYSHFQHCPFLLLQMSLLQWWGLDLGSSYSFPWRNEYELRHCSGPIPPLTSLLVVLEPFSYTGTLIREGAWLTLPHLPVQPTTLTRRWDGDSPRSAGHWSGLK